MSTRGYRRSEVRCQDRLGNSAATDRGPGAVEAQGGALPSLDGEPVGEQYPEEVFSGRCLALVVYDTDSENLN